MPVPVDAVEIKLPDIFRIIGKEDSGRFREGVFHGALSSVVILYVSIEISIYN